METEMAMQKLAEARESLDGDLADMVDTLATLVALQQDISEPMLGAKVTLWDRPQNAPYMCPESEVPEGASDWQVTTTTDDKDYWSKWSFPWLNEEPEDDPDTVVKFYKREEEDAPDLIGREAIVVEGNVSGGAPEGNLWDPNKEEYKTRDEYPMGTVNCVVSQDRQSDELQSFTDMYTTDVKVYTSITPANGEPAPHTYTPGWD